MTELGKIDSKNKNSTLPVGTVLLVKLEPDKVTLSIGELLPPAGDRETPKARNINGELYDQYAFFG